jgi:hypothetical protein
MKSELDFERLLADHDLCIRWLRGMERRGVNFGYDIRLLSHDEKKEVARHIMSELEKREAN